MPFINTCLINIKLKNNKFIVKYKSDNSNDWTELVNRDWTLGIRFTDAPLCIGNRLYSTSQYLKNGSIDLKQFSITVDGKEVFSGNKTGIDTIKADNYTVVGNPVISEDGVASGFDTSNYITIPYLANFATKNVFDFTFKYKTSTLNQFIIASSNGAFRVEIANSYFQIKYSNTHTFYVDYRKTVSDGDIIRIRLTINDNSMNHCTVWINNIIANEIKNNTTDFSSFSFSNLRIGVGNNDAYKFIGSIDLNSFKIYVDGNLVYQPCLKIPYTESKTGSKIVDAVYRDRVEDCYNQYGTGNYYLFSSATEQFALPMPDIYGLIENLKLDITAIEGADW